MKFEMLVELIQKEINDLEESKDLWLKQLDECPFDSTAESQVNEISAKIRCLKSIIEQSKEL